MPSSLNVWRGIVSTPSWTLATHAVLTEEGACELPYVSQHTMLDSCLGFDANKEKDHATMQATRWVIALSLCEKITINVYIARRDRSDISILMHILDVL